MGFIVPDAPRGSQWGDLSVLTPCRAELWHRCIPCTLNLDGRWVQQCQAAAAAKIPLALQWGQHPLCAEGIPSSSGTSSPSPLGGKSVSWRQRWWQWQGGEREPRCPRGCEEGELPAGVVGFSSIRGVTRDRAVPSCTLGVFCTPGASEGFCFVLWLLPALALPCTVRVSVWHCQEPPVPLPARVTPHLPSLCQTQCWLLAAKENIAVV